MRRLPSLTTAVVMTAATALTLSACSTDPVATEPKPAADGEPATMTVESAFGSVELPTEPQRALGMYTTDVDILDRPWASQLADQQPIRGDGYTTFPSSSRRTPWLTSSRSPTTPTTTTR